MTRDGPFGGLIQGMLMQIMRKKTDSDWVRLGWTGRKSFESVKSVVIHRIWTTDGTDIMDESGRWGCSRCPVTFWSMNSLKFHHVVELTSTRGKRKTYRRIVGAIF